MLNTLKSVKYIDPKGNDVTPEKLKKLQRKRESFTLIRIWSKLLYMFQFH